MSVGVTYTKNIYIDTTGENDVTTTGTTVFTVPSGQYAIMSAYCRAFASTITVNLAGSNMAQFTAAGQLINGVYIGPGAVTHNHGGGANSVHYSWVIFKNVI